METLLYQYCDSIKTYGKNGDTLVLKNITPFNWDHLYVTGGPIDTSFLDKEVGFKTYLPDLQEYEGIYFFVKDKKVVNWFKYTSYEVKIGIDFFNYAKTKPSNFLTPENAVFNIKTEVYKGKVIFLLEHIE